MYNFFKQNKQLLVNCFNYSILFCIFLFLCKNFRYIIVSYDDLIDMVITPFTIHHGRFLTECFEKFTIHIIPNFFNIHIQNFAFISEGVIKAIEYCFVIHVCSMSLFQFKKPDFFLGILYVCFLFFFTYLIANHIGMLIHWNQQWAMGYFFSTGIFLIFIFKLYRYCICEQKTKKDKIILFTLAFLMPSFNEMVGFISLIIMLLLIKKDKSLKTPIILNLIMWCYYIFFGFFMVINEKIFDINGCYPFDLFSLKNIYDFICVNFKVIFLDNLYSWILLAILFLFLTIKRKNEKVKEFIAFILYLLLGLFLFLICLYFMGDSNNYPCYLPDIRNFWITYFGIIIPFKIILFSINLYIIGFLLSLNNKKIYTYINYIAISLIFASIIIPNKNSLIYFCDKENKETLYILDKLANFYLKQGKTAILPRDNIYSAMPYFMPDDLSKENYSKQIYYSNPQNYDLGILDNLYMAYLVKVYNLDVSAGITFRDSDEAMQIYKDNNGILTDEELKKLDFNKIN